MDIGKQNLSIRHKQKPAAAFVAVIGLIVGFILGYVSQSIVSDNPLSSSKSPAGKADTFAAGWQAARERLDELGVFPAANMVGEVKLLNGEIKEVGKGVVVFRARLIHPMDDKTLEERVAKITKDTEIILRRTTTDEEKAAEQKKQEDKVKPLRDKLASLEKGRQYLELKEQIDTPAGAVNMELQDEYMSLRNDETIEDIVRQIEELAMSFTVGGMYKEVSVKLSELKINDYIRVEANEDIAQKKEFVATRILADKSVAPSPMPAPTGSEQAVPAPTDNEQAPAAAELSDVENETEPVIPAPPPAAETGPVDLPLAE